MSEHHDVLIIGAGLSGIGSACHLRRQLPGKSYAILEAREAIGGTWDLFRFPGIRSDSDMFTLGYDFKPWLGRKAIVDGPDIKAYIEEAAREHGVVEHIRFGHRVLSADWDSATARWTVECERAGSQERVRLTCGWLHSCGGYYRYDEGYVPDFPGMADFSGRIVHPQAWPEDLDYAGRRVVVIGSGATAITLAPALAAQAAHVTMLQRSPTYLISQPGSDPVDNVLRRWLPEMAAYRLARLKHAAISQIFYNLSRSRPSLVRRVLGLLARCHLPRGYQLEPNFTPRYNPWDERVCVVPDADFFHAVGDGSVSVVTDTIATFTEPGLRLNSGRELEADIVVTATGFNVQLLGGARVSVDGVPVDPGERFSYRAMMLSGVPNLAFAFGYTNASWTLRADLTSRHMDRLIAHMDAHGYDYCVPVAPEDEPSRPFLDLASGYIHRAQGVMPLQGAREPWTVNQDWFRDQRLYRREPLVDAGIRFGHAGERATGPATEAPEAARAVSHA